jgi:hypothetical protein
MRELMEKRRGTNGFVPARGTDWQMGPSAINRRTHLPKLSIFPLFAKALVVAAGLPALPHCRPLLNTFTPMEVHHRGVFASVLTCSFSQIGSE